MTLEEGLNLEKRFFHQTFGTVSILGNLSLYRKLKVIMSFPFNDNSMCICARLLHLFKHSNIKPLVIRELVTDDNSDGHDCKDGLC